MSPQALAGLLFIPLASLGIGAATAGALALGLGYIGFGALLIGGSALLSGAGTRPSQPEAPKPEDGKFNLKQNVPSLTYILGRVKKGGDYAFLEEGGGTAFHIMVDAAHPIDAYEAHYLHDELVTPGLDGWLSLPSHFGGERVRIRTRSGADASTYYPEVAANFPGLWGADHRGDGLATVMMATASVPSVEFQTVYPAGMPVRTSIIRGHSRIFDPRTSAYGYSENLALHRLWHLTHPVGGKLTLDDMYLPDWIAAADCCDETVVSRAGENESRYHGGFWFRADNDPREVGRILDQAAELVVYERPDGTVGVHPGAYVTPDVRLSADDLLAVSFDANRRRASTVLAVRGRYTDPEKGFNTVDSAIYGDPYEDESERTKTVENQAVQRHSHMARLQKLAYLRANAPRVRLVAHFEAARQVPYRRFVRIHYPPKLDEAVIEIIGRPTLSLRSLTYEFEGIVVPPNLYDFDAATEEGAPGLPVAPVPRSEVPIPDDFDVTIETETVGGGTTSVGVATFTANALFQVELEWQPTAGGDKQSALSTAGAASVRSGYLADGTEYRFRGRTWSAAAASAWTSYTILTA